MKKNNKYFINHLILRGMGMFSKMFSPAKKTAAEKLSTGELNWRLKPEIKSIVDYPNFVNFISKIESENDIQFGLGNDVVNEIQKTLILRQPIYNANGLPIFTFSLFFQYIGLIDEISLMGFISNFNNPSELLNPQKNHFINIRTKKNQDLSVEEYEKYYWEVLKQSFSVQGFNHNEYFIKGKKCAYKIMEEIIRSES